MARSAMYCAVHMPMPGTRIMSVTMSVNDAPGLMLNPPFSAKVASD